MSIVNLISTKTLRDEYMIDENLDEKYYLPLIKKAQDFIIKPLLGEDFYNLIINQVINNNLSVKNKTIIDDYIQPIIAYYVMGEVVFSTAYKLKNAGVDAGDQYKFSELVKISDKYRKDCDSYQQILTKYVCDNSIATIPEKNTFKVGLYLGQSYPINYYNQPDKNKLV